MDFEKIIAKIRAGKTWRFHGGIHPAEHKKESSETPIERLEPASVYIVPVRQHSGDAGTIVVKTGNYVRKGDPLTRSSGRRDLPVSAPTSGTIGKIGLHTAPHQSGLPDLEITITPDGKDEWRERHPIADFRTKSPDELLSVIHQAGIAGMGGAGFPADQKIAGAVGKTHILIINGSECEPYITCDDRLMREKAAEIVEGIRILKYILKPEVAIIAIEDNKQEAAKAIKDAVREDDDIIVRVLETRGIEMQNVATTYAIKRAVEDDEPLVERIVTVTGNNFGRKGNFIVPFGTPVRHILDKCEWHGEARNELILGGPMMGFTVPTPDVSVTKTVNCVFSPDSSEVMSYDNPLECIRCGRCARVCPSRLLPFALVKAAKAGDSEAIQRERIRDCIECGCCAFVCPSRIPLVRYIRIAKARLREESAEARKKQNTERLIAEKLSREEKIAAARKARIAALKESSAPKADSAAATATNEQEVQKSVSAAAENTSKPRSAALAAALARAKAAKAKNGQKNETEATQAGASANAASGNSRAGIAAVTAAENYGAKPSAGSAKSKALAAALARAKAKKAAESGSSGSPASQDEEKDTAAPEAKPAASAKSAAVAAALAKARARKAAESGPAPERSGNKDANKAESSETKSSPASHETADAASSDPKKAALAAALARAKARKQAESASTVTKKAAGVPGKSAENGEKAESSGSSGKDHTENPRKAAVAAALARARAKKQSAAGNINKPDQAAKSEEEQVPSEENK